jgi:hypothetical protein
MSTPPPPQILSTKIHILNDYGCPILIKLNSNTGNWLYIAQW